MQKMNILSSWVGVLCLALCLLSPIPSFSQFAPPCTIVTYSIDVTAESCAGANDGSITYNACFSNGVCTGIQYSIDGGPFQSSNTFTGLAAGSHTLSARYLAPYPPSSCSKTDNATVDAGPDCGPPCTTTLSTDNDDFPAGQMTQWTVPAGVTEVTIVARGGDGGVGDFPSTGGEGATAEATFPVTPGHTLNVIVGGSGNFESGGGGAGVYNISTSQILIVAGGGGGASDASGKGGRASEQGGNSTSGVAGGTNGNGGSGSGGGGGGGAFSSGANGAAGAFSGGGGQGVPSGGSGGAFGGAFGFGGGGGNGSSGGGGGGGGYSGGGGGTGYGDGGGGGGSFVHASGTNVTITAGADGAGFFNNGSVTICYSSGPACDIVIDDITPTAETCPGANDGGLTVSASCSTCSSIEYSIDGVNFQPGNTFSDLAPGAYTVTVRDAGDASCEATDNATVNGGPTADSDGDGTEDCNDGCPDDPDKIEPGLCGCGTADDDSDGDGTLDCNDGCPDDPNKIEPGVCGCGVSDDTSPEIVSPLSVPVDPNPLGTVTDLSASFTEACDQDDHTAVWYWGDGSSSAGTVHQGANSVTGSHTYGAPGVYTVTLVVSDGDGNSDEEAATTYIVIYDPSGGFVTGGGWIMSPAGALVGSPATGKANFGFVSKYKKGTNVPTGNTTFQFKAGDFKFESTEYEWLVVAGEKAKYKGLGEVNNSGNYGFMLTAIDGDKQGNPGPDKFRLKVWDKNNGDAVVYDNQLGSDDSGYDTQVLGGGSVVIHGGGNGNNALLINSPAAPVETPTLQAYPNPFVNQVQLQIDLPARGRVNLSLFNLQGQRVSVLADEVLDAGTHQLEWNGRSDSGRELPAGVYFARLQTEGGETHLQLVLTR